MFSKAKYFVFIMVVLALFSLGCSEDTTAPADTGSTLREYLVENDLDLNYILTDWIIAASGVYPNEANYYIMDIRSSEHFGQGRITGAVNSTLGTIVADAAANTEEKPILIVCYTGQSASHALVALRLSGYPDCQVLKFGFSSWSGDFDSWTSNTSSSAVGHANWSTEATTALVEYDYPTIDTEASSGADILKKRVTFMTEEFKGVSGTDVLTTPGNYFINNYWDLVDVETYGHIAGAYRINPLTLAGGEFKNYDPDKTVVTYCWTGQTSSVITAYLTVLGYDALSLKFGTNGLIFDELLTHKWPGSANYPIVSD